jgi:hypothetical protein
MKTIAILTTLAFATFSLASAHDSEAIGVAFSQECAGCTKKSISTGDGVLYTLINWPLVGNGQCNGIIPNCNGTACEYAGTLEIQNATALSFWVDTDGNGLGPRVMVQSGDNFVLMFEDSALPCGSQFLVTIDDAGVNGNEIASYGWKCTACPSTE